MEQTVLYITFIGMLIGAIILVLLQQFGRWLRKNPPKDKESRSIWEYKISEINRNETSKPEIEELLNEFGEHNWELVSTSRRTLELMDLDDRSHKDTIEEHVYTLFFKRRTIKYNA